MKYIFHILIILIVLSWGMHSCKKPDPPKALIITLDTSYKPLANVKVTVFAQPNGSYIDPNDKVLNLKGTTDASGQVRFEFKNEAIFNVKAEYGNPVTRQANGVIVLKEDEEITKTLILR